MGQRVIAQESDDPGHEAFLRLEFPRAKEFVTQTGYKRREREVLRRRAFVLAALLLGSSAAVKAAPFAYVPNSGISGSGPSTVSVIDSYLEKTLSPTLSRKR